jgi:hypothetical protein
MPESSSASWVALPNHESWTLSNRRAFQDLAKALPATTKRRRESLSGAQSRCERSGKPALVAASRLIVDLAEQGWAIKVDSSGRVLTQTSKSQIDPEAEKSRVRRQELLKRDENLATVSVQKFVTEMERPREYNGSFISIFSLMRDGLELSESLKAIAGSNEGSSEYRRVIDPYIQLATAEERCSQTGLKLADIWRYFRLTWSNQSASTPGRTMMLLVRDRAASNHPIIGIAAIGSSIVQIKQRDRWIGWQSSELLAELDKNPSLRMARWVVQRLDNAISEIYVDDLVRDGFYWPSLLKVPTAEAILSLRREAKLSRRNHHRYIRRSELQKSIPVNDPDVWRVRAESDLFRSKRCLALASLLESRMAIRRFLYPSASRAGLKRALGDSEGRKAIADVIRRAKSEAVGTEIGDLTVCGAIAPYNSLLGGKLVSMLAVSPWVVKTYRERYVDYSSIIASSVAGRPIRRRTNLVFIGTTSLYGSGSSQYNRVKIPCHVLNGRQPIEYRNLGKSLSYGTSQFSERTVSALVYLSEQSRAGVRVNSIFGEGVNPKLRKVRDGIDLLGWPAESLMRHGRQRIVYGVNLVTNLLPYLLGSDSEPEYVFRRNISDDIPRIAEWWIERWLIPRSKSEEVLADVAINRTSRPVRHGARVPKLVDSDSD